MPQDPRRGDFGHRNPRSEQDSEESAASRRRRSLGDDGTGGTRVMDLLSKHGKAPAGGTGSHRRRAAEPEDEAEPEQSAGQQGTGQRSDESGQPSQDPPRSGGAGGRRSRSNRNGHPQANGHSQPIRPPNGAAAGPPAAAPGTPAPGTPAPSGPAAQQTTGESPAEQTRYQQPPQRSG